MRKESIISIIRKYGLNSKKISTEYHVKYDDALKMLSEGKNGQIRVVNAVDNVLNPEKSMSHKCQISSCGKRIRYEYWIKDEQNNKTISVGLNCACAMLGKSKLATKTLKSIDMVMREKAELEDWKVQHKNTYTKLLKIEKLNLVHFNPFCEEIKHSALNQEDTKYIDSVNYKLLLINVKYMDILKELMKYDQNNELYKSIYKRIAYDCVYISNKQKEVINEAYEKYQKNKLNETITVSNGYEHRDVLKNNGYIYIQKSKLWIKRIKRKDADSEIEKLLSYGIKKGEINERN